MNNPSDSKDKTPKQLDAYEMAHGVQLLAITDSQEGTTLTVKSSDTTFDIEAINIRWGTKPTIGDTISILQLDNETRITKMP